ncbi:MAG: hypothetical protein COU68_03260 [Candidatus Pacebacteria bacterium CG10_big_fil_rev_8_21_14_0_10_45_6]|nr:MAG: hypothetical protein COU68_03260 [Candidatus Pacebacteria bacterium CG10_big_fil_rev_8_21_14_0_10_45_6]
MLNPQSQQPATYNKHGMTALGTTTPPMKQKKSFGMRSILTVVGLSLFFIIAISGVLIAQRQSQVDAPVAPTAPVSRPSAAEPINACQITFNVAFTPGQSISNTYTCDADCTDTNQCTGVNSNFICYRPDAGNGVDQWTPNWFDSSVAIPANVGAGLATSFDALILPDNTVKQYLVRGGELFVRTATIDTATKEAVGWTSWVGPNTAVTAETGTGTLTSFAGYVQKDGAIKQYAVKGGELWVRTSTDNINWTLWDGPNVAANGFGSGEFTSFSAYVQPDGATKQFFIKGGALAKRDNAGGKCRLSTLPTANDCQAVVVPGTATCTSKKAFTDFSTITTSTELTSATPLKKGQEFVYRITAKGGTTPAANVTITDQLPAELTYVGPVGDSVITHSNGLVTVTYPTVGEAPKVAEFKVKVAATTVAGANVINKATIKTEGANPSECSVTLKVEAAAADYSCNKPCTTTTQCQDTTKGGNALYSCDTVSNTCRLTTNPTSTTCEAKVAYVCNSDCTGDTAEADCKAVNNDYTCSAAQGNKCRLSTNLASSECKPKENVYSCGVTCTTTDQCKSYNTAYVCHPVGGAAGSVCRLGNGNEQYSNCQAPNTPPPAPTVGCNVTCATTADCSNSAHICYDTALIGQSYGKVCRLPDYVYSTSCTTPTETVAYTPPTGTKGGQPALPAELPQTGPEDWLNWLKAGLITLGVGAALLLLL